MLRHCEGLLLMMMIGNDEKEALSKKHTSQ